MLTEGALPHNYFGILEAGLLSQERSRLKGFLGKRLFIQEEINDIHMLLLGCHAHSPLYALMGERTDRTENPMPYRSNDYFAYHAGRQGAMDLKEYLELLGVSEEQYMCAQYNCSEMFGMYQKGTLPKVFIPLVVPGLDIAVVSKQKIPGLISYCRNTQSGVVTRIFEQYPGCPGMQPLLPRKLVRFVL